MHSLSPCRGFGIRRFIPLSVTGLASPDLTAEPEIVVDDPNPGATLRRTGGGSHARRPSANHEHLEMGRRFPGHCFHFPVFTSRCSLRFHFSLLTSMPCLHKTWQPRLCGIPSIATRHS
jgi:hypothetical protein